MSDYSELKRLAEAATPGRNFDRLPAAGGGLKYECRGDDGSLVLKVDHKNCEFGFIGERCEQDEAFFLSCTPAAVLALIAENKRLAELLECSQGDMRQAQKIMDLDMKDAERYRYIRKDGYRDVDTDEWSGDGAAMDAFVDAYMEEGQQ